MDYKRFKKLWEQAGLAKFTAGRALTRALLRAAEGDFSTFERIEHRLAKLGALEAAARRRRRPAKSCPAIDLAKRFHEIYEALAPSFGYRTRRRSRVPWSRVPARNRRLMVAVCEQLMVEGATWPR